MQSDVMYVSSVIHIKNDMTKCSSYIRRMCVQGVSLRKEKRKKVHQIMRSEQRSTMIEFSVFKDRNCKPAT